MKKRKVFFNFTILTVLKLNELRNNNYGETFLHFKTTVTTPLTEFSQRD